MMRGGGDLGQPGGQGVEPAELEPAAGPDRREEGGAVVVEVGHGGAATVDPVVHPLAEGDRRSGRRAGAVVVVEQHHLGRRARRPPSRRRGSPLASTGRVRVGSMASQVARRAERWSRSGEQAKAAASAGPMWWASRHRRARVAASPESRLTWIEAQLDIMRRPAGP